MSRPALVVLPAAIALLLAGAAGARGQGLGDAAARERQKREAQKAKAREPGRVYGNEDLPQHEEDKKKGSGKAAEPASAAPSVGAEESGGNDAASVFAARRARIAEAESAVSAAQADVDRLEARVRQLQDMLNPMSPSYIYGRPASGDMVAAEARAREELQQSEPRLVEARKALAAARQGLEDAQLGRTSSPQS